ncbi:AAA family ATPase [Patescibacteria group bacterium]|nr:AAA family ATPase [Patescibacteria group bacterium]
MMRTRISKLCQSICANLVEREEAAKLVLLATLAGDHVLLLGPPGTAKSEIARRLRGCIDEQEGRFFERLLTKFSVPEELFGPLSIQGLERDEYHRLTEGYLPTASVAFLDEIFKANSAILNAILTILNEREFDNGAHRVKVPLISVVAASNEVPEGAELAALYDRFLVRYRVGPVSNEGFRALLDLDEARDQIETGLRLRREELEAIQSEAAAVELPGCVRNLLGSLRKALDEKGLYVSDRRWRKILRLLRVAASTEDRGEVSLSDCWLAAHCLWSRPEQEEIVRKLISETLKEILEQEPERYGMMADAFEKELEIEGLRDEPARNDEGQALYYDNLGNIVDQPFEPCQATDNDGVPIFYGPSELKDRKGRDVFTFVELWEEHFSQKPKGLERLNQWVENPANQVSDKHIRQTVRAPASYSDEHIESRSGQIEGVLRDLRELMGSIESLRGSQGQPFWVSAELCDSVKGLQDKALEMLSPVEKKLVKAVEEARKLRRRSSQ